MQQSNTALAQNIRRIGMVMGFAFFLFFVYKASHDVSSPKIAAGAQRTQTVNVANKTLPAFGGMSPGYGFPVTVTVSSNATNTPKTDSRVIYDDIQSPAASKKPAKDYSSVKVAKDAKGSKPEKSDD